MAEFTISEMQEMQKQLQDKYKNIWEQIGVDTGKNKLLWMIGEVGEVIDIVKKHGSEASNADNPEREHLIEELADVRVCMNAVADIAPIDLIVDMAFKKTERWEKRINGGM